ncbi:MAG TPA: hypothetical protein DCZ69_19170 [Syntrophobacteraceae bacterium]|nr:hypothetical protein [Syntrophobacteraceae bacterium]
MLTRKKEELETQLSALSQRFALEERRKRATANSLSQVLPKGSALVEFSRFEVSDFRATKRKSGSFHYLAFILHPGKGSRVGLVDLGDTRKIDNAVAELRKAVRNTLNPRQEDLFQAARGLHDLVFSPLRKELGTARRLYVSPDGNLNLIPFEILRGPNDRFLIEDYTFNYLAAGRDLLGQGAKHGEPGRILLVGDPDFDKLREGALPGDVGTGTVVSPPPRGAFRTVRELRFGRLPGTRKEVMALADLLGREQVDLRLDEKANEDVLHFVDPPRVLHLATHGFFLNDRMLSGPDPLVSGRGFEIIDPQSVPGGTLGREAQESPLLRSGFALAGANAALAAGDPEVGSGIVTAEKILGMNLHGVEMVVLSACETGLGEVKAGEGVFGLRRAFVQAGARSLVMSLWNVPDQETQELMVAFYGRLVRGGINRNEALRQAALAELRIVTKRYGFPHPFYWGAFVFLGEP